MNPSQGFVSFHSDISSPNNGNGKFWNYHFVPIGISHDYIKIRKIQSARAWPRALPYVRRPSSALLPPPALGGGLPPPVTGRKGP